MDFLSTRFDPETKIMNLSSIATDEYWSNKKRRLNIFNETDCNTLAKVIKDKLPDLSLIDLSKNKLRFTNQFTKLVESTPEVTYITLEGNSFDREYDVSNTFGRWKKLTGLILTSNPISDNKSVTELAAKLKRNGRFPALTTINDENIPEGIGFDIEVNEETVGDGELPEDNFVGVHEENQAMADGLQSFLEDFVKCHNDESGMKGQNLLKFYHDNCAVSISTQKLPNKYESEKTEISHLFNRSRNLKIESKQKISPKRGKLQAVSFFTELPNYKIKESTVAFDIVNVVSDIIHIAVSGECFEEGGSRNGGGPLPFYERNFQRQLLIQEDKNGTNSYGVLILNDMLMICARKNETENKSSVSSSGLAAQLGGEKKSQNDLLVQFMTDSGLKLQYAKECLEKASWNYENAGKLFMESKANIPQEYYQ